MALALDELQLQLNVVTLVVLLTVLVHWHDLQVVTLTEVLGLVALVEALPVAGTETVTHEQLYVVPLTKLH